MLIEPASLDGDEMECIRDGVLEPLEAETEGLVSAA